MSSYFSSSYFPHVLWCQVLTWECACAFKVDSITNITISLLFQENYLKTEPAKVRDITGPMKSLTHLTLMDKAAASLSDSDLVDALIHG